mmetsp:Transcript_36397/g.84686  ORF Transcript_36397/g.84686 Transcript_36397/m.84686 type:complete len:81 (-) Transcript_36397:131-373(-)
MTTRVRKKRAARVATNCPRSARSATQSGTGARAYPCRPSAGTTSARTLEGRVKQKKETQNTQRRERKKQGLIPYNVSLES